MIKKVYLSGAMQSFNKDNFNYSNYWRTKAIDYFREFYPNKIEGINPNDYWSFNDDEITYSSDREVMDFDLYKLKECDLVLIYFNALSIGSAIEIATAYELRKPIIGVHVPRENDDIEYYELHPWEKSMCNRIFNNLFDALEYIGTYYS